MKTLLLTILLLITFSGCSSNAEGLYIQTREPSKCINGFQYFSSGKGAAVFLNTEGHPVPCSMRKI